jgi:hypothetical protein
LTPIQESAHACSEIGLKWFLFALHDLGTALGFVSAIDFSGILSFSSTGETGKLELKPFLTILGTRMRANMVFFNIENVRAARLM